MLIFIAATVRRRSSATGWRRAISRMARRSMSASQRVEAGVAADHRLGQGDVAPGDGADRSRPPRPRPGRPCATSSAVMASSSSS